MTVAELIVKLEALDQSLLVLDYVTDNDGDGWYEMAEDAKVVGVHRRSTVDDSQFDHSYKEAPKIDFYGVIIE